MLSLLVEEQISLSLMETRVVMRKIDLKLVLLHYILTFASILYALNSSLRDLNKFKQNSLAPLTSFEAFREM